MKTVIETAKEVGADIDAFGNGSYSEILLSTTELEAFAAAIRQQVIEELVGVDVAMNTTNGYGITLAGETLTLSSRRNWEQPMACKQHDLIKLVAMPSGDGPGIETVIRWCRACGCVVGDIDVDGRTSPGAYFKMIFPKGQQ